MDRVLSLGKFECQEGASGFFSGYCVAVNRDVPALAVRNSCHQGGIVARCRNGSCDRPLGVLRHFKRMCLQFLH